MAVTAPTDIAGWIPTVIASGVYDTMFDSTYGLSAAATVYNDLEGQPGQGFSVPTLAAITAATNLAVTTAATDDLISGSSVSLTIQEAVKSVAFYDRTQYVTGTDVNRIAGEKVGQALALRQEYDLGAAVYAGRNTAADFTSTLLDLPAIRTFRGKLPAAMRPGLGRDNNKPILFADNDTLSQLYADTTVANAAALGPGDNPVTSGDFVRPFYGIRLVEVDAGIFGSVGLTGTQKWAALVAPGCLARAIQKQGSNKPERDERARLTRIVSTVLHAEGVIDARGVVMAKIGTP